MVKRVTTNDHPGTSNARAFPWAGSACADGNSFAEVFRDLNAELA
jgi:hypothetical protein